MGKGKISFFGLEAWEENYLKPLLDVPNGLLFNREKLNADNLLSAGDSEVLSIFIYDKVTKDILDLLPNLKLIATRSTGYDHIDIKACRENGILISNVPFYGESTVAEHTFALILSLSRNIHKAYVRTVREDFTIEGLRGFDLNGKTIGVIGAGHIGLHVVKMAKGFGMNALVFDIKKDSFLEEVLMFRYASFEEVLRSSDVITLHVPYNEKTHHIINRDNIKLIKKGALLINTARGGLVDTDALSEALDKGILSGAGLDVLEEEDLIKEEGQLLSKDFPVEKLRTLFKNHILLKRDNVVITPHIAFNSVEAISRILICAVDNIKSYLEGKPRNLLSYV